MKFDVVIGNPPYGKDTDQYFYQKFVQMGKTLAPICAWVTPVALFRRNMNYDLTCFKVLGQYFKAVQVTVCYFVIQDGGKTKPTYDAVVDRIASSKNCGLTLINHPQTLRRCDAAGGSTKVIISCGRRDGDFDYGFTDKVDAIAGLGKHKVVCSRVGSVNKLGSVKYAGPDIGIADSSIGVEVNSKEEAMSLISYLQTKLGKAFIAWAKFYACQNPRMRLIPTISLDRIWDDGSVYEHFGLTPEEINHIDNLKG
jgi:hypothetical protein